MTMTFNLVARFRAWWTQSLFPTADSGASPMSGIAWAALILLMYLAGSLLFHGLSYPLVEPDEGRYAEIGREMVSRGDWIVPRFNDQAYLDKPPLFYWLIAASVGLFGAEEWSARLVPCTATFLLILVTFFFGRRILGTLRAMLGAFVLTLMGGVIIAGRMLILDAVLTLMVALALFTAYEAVQGGQVRRGWWILSAVFAALGVMVKGPVALALVLPPVLAMGWFSSSPPRPRVRDWLIYGAIILAVISPWFIAITIRCPEFPYYFFVKHHLVRFFGEEHHPQPFWFYVPVLLLGCLPWSLLLVPFCIFLFSRRQEYRTQRTAGMGYLLLWAGCCLGFFSASRGKLAPYILPAMPPLALLVSCYLEMLLFSTSASRLRAWTNRFIPRQTAAFLVLVWIGVFLGLWATGITQPPWFSVEVMKVAGGAALILALAVYGRRMTPSWSWMVCCAVMVFLIRESTAGFLPAWAARRSPFCRQREVEALFQDRNARVAFLPEFGSIPFRLNHDGFALHVGDRGADEVKRFLSRSPHGVLIADNDFPLSMAGLFVPEHMHVERFFNSGKTRFFLLSDNSSVRPVPAAAAMHALAR